MLDAEGFVQAGWVHDLRLHELSSSVRFVVKGKNIPNYTRTSIHNSNT